MYLIFSIPLAASLIKSGRNTLGSVFRRNVRSSCKTVQGAYRVLLPASGALPDT